MSRRSFGIGVRSRQRGMLEFEAEKEVSFDLAGCSLLLSLG